MTIAEAEVRADRGTQDAPDAAGRAIAALLAALDAATTEAGRRARARGRPVLASVVRPAPAVDPLDGLDALAAAAATDAELAAALARGRFYWSRPSEAVALAGAGAAALVAPTGEGRFAAADAAWRELLDGAVVDDASEGAEGAGPLLVGGFSFDPGGPQAGHWAGFPSARLVLPRAQLAAVGGASWLTATVRVGADGRPDAAPAAVGRLARALLAGAGGDVPPHAAGSSAAAVQLQDAVPAGAWRALVADAVAETRGGTLEKVVVARAVRASAARAFDVSAALRALRARYPDCYVFACWAEDGAAFVGASPERLVRVDGDRVRATSLAGSAPRGPGDDRGAALLASAKDRAEHAIVRGALVGALGELCDAVEAAPAPSLRALANVYHLQTSVRGRLRTGRSVFDLVARLHPTPAVGGAPRAAALHFLTAREGLDRGWYAAPVGWVGRAGGEFAVGLRSGVVRGAEAWLFAGCGIVADSDPAREYDESRAKLRAMEQALAAAAVG